MKHVAGSFSAAVVLLAGLSGAQAQSLFRQPAPPPPAKPDAFPGGTPAGPAVRGDSPANANPAPANTSPQEQQPASRASEISLKQASLMYVEAPKPKTYEVHDKVSIIISEVSSQSSEQSLDAKKDASLKAAVNKFPDINRFLQANLTNTSASEPIGAVDVTGNSSYKGDGKFQRNDKFTDRIEATVIDVKPNGVLVLEARKTVGQDKEIRSLVLSGECRREDVTDNNTVLSSQLSDLTILAHTEGDAKDTASKGILTRLVEAIFNF
jgi:flagellar L-ring protein precursor FlgH